MGKAVHVLSGGALYNMRQREERMKDPRCRRCGVPLTDENWSKRRTGLYGYGCRKCASDDTRRLRASNEWGWLHGLVGNVNSRKLDGKKIGRVVTADIKPKFTGKCFWCGCPLEKEIGKGRSFGGGRTIDHLVPVTRGGKTEVINLEFSCWPCNQMKGNLLPSEFIARMEAILALHRNTQWPQQAQS